MAQQFDDKLLLDMETNFYCTAYQLKWLSKIQVEFNTTITTNTNTFPIHTLDHPIHPPLSKKKRTRPMLSRLKRSILSILKRIPQN